MNTLTPEQQKEVDELNQQIQREWSDFDVLTASAGSSMVRIRELTAKRCEITGE